MGFFDSIGNAISSAYNKVSSVLNYNPISAAGYKVSNNVVPFEVSPATVVAETPSILSKIESASSIIGRGVTAATSLLTTAKKVIVGGVVAAVGIPVTLGILQNKNAVSSVVSLPKTIYSDTAAITNKLYGSEPTTKTDTAVNIFGGYSPVINGTQIPASVPDPSASTNNSGSGITNLTAGLIGGATVLTAEGVYQLIKSYNANNSTQTDTTTPASDVSHIQPTLIGGSGTSTYGQSPTTGQTINIYQSAHPLEPTTPIKTTTPKKTTTHKYKSRKKVNGRWVYKY